MNIAREFGAFSGQGPGGGLARIGRGFGIGAEGVRSPFAFFDSFRNECERFELALVFVSLLVNECLCHCHKHQMNTIDKNVNTKDGPAGRFRERPLDRRRRFGKHMHGGAHAALGRARKRKPAYGRAMPLTTFGHARKAATAARAASRSSSGVRADWAARRIAEAPGRPRK